MLAKENKCDNQCAQFSQVTNIFPISYVKTSNQASSNKTIPRCIKKTKLLLNKLRTVGKVLGVLCPHATFNHLLYPLELRSTFVNYDVDDVLIVFLPFYHISGLLTLVIALHAGCKTIVIPKFDLKRFLEIIQSYKATVFFAIPSVLVSLAKDPLAEQYDLSSVKRICFGAAPCGAELLESLQKRFRNLENMIQVRRQYYHFTT